jgi:chromosome segregation ATPase
MLESFGKKKNELLNDIIQLTNILNGQEAELETAYDSSARLDHSISRSKKKMEDNYKRVASTYSLLLSNFSKLTKSLEHEGALRKNSKKRTSVLGDVDPKSFVRRGDRLKTEVPTANNLQDELAEEELGEEPLRQESLEQLARCLHSMHRLQQDMTALKRFVKQVNESINDFVSTLETELQKVFTCKNCFQKYTQLTNSKNSCSYHPGKTKYYYCKSCESDEYFSCCQSCSRCNPACKVGQHVPILPYRSIN